MKPATPISTNTAPNRSVTARTGLRPVGADPPAVTIVVLSPQPLVAALPPARGRHASLIGKGLTRPVRSGGDSSSWRAAASRPAAAPGRRGAAGGAAPAGGGGGEARGGGGGVAPPAGPGRGSRSRAASRLRSWDRRSLATRVSWS